MSNFIYPTTKNVTSGFRTPDRPNHNGVDFSEGKNEPIYASASGIVSRSYVSTSYGEVIFIKHTINGKKYETVYAHMVTGSRLVFEGNTVRQGQRIGTMGTTGDSTGIHLHFELCIPEWIQGGANAVDPIPYLKGQSGGGGGDLNLICENRYLNRDEMFGNAQYIANYFVNQGWTSESISGMLGNMERESTMNPCLWQNLDSGNTRLGFGLVQWTPATNLINWANGQGLEYANIDTQLSRISWELENNQQWIATLEFFYSFEEFTKKTDSPETLAKAFLRNYERAGVEELEERQANARYWYELLNWSGEWNGGNDNSKDKTTEYIELLLCGAVNGWQF